MSPPALLSFKGQATKQETVKWSIYRVAWPRGRPYGAEYPSMEMFCASGEVSMVGLLDSFSSV